MLVEIGLSFIETNQEFAQEDSFGKNFSSPTLLLDDDIAVFGVKINSSEGACSTNLPNRRELISLLNELI